MIKTTKEFLNLSIADLEEFGVRTKVIDSLDRQGIIHVRDLQRKTREELLALPSFGVAYLTELVQALQLANKTMGGGSA